MNIKVYFDCYNAAKREFHRSISKIMLSRMVAQNIQDILPDWIKIEPYSYVPQIIRLIPTIDINAEQFDKFVTRFSKKIGSKPKVTIGDEFEASWWVHPRMQNNDYWYSIGIEFNTSNAEKCDITYKDVVVQQPVLTGYCKALADKYQ